jgi:hypothetical protein
VVLWPIRKSRSDLGEMAQDVIIIPSAAAVMTPKVTQPKYLSDGEFTRLPITSWLLVRRITSRIRGGARRRARVAAESDSSGCYPTGSF